MVFRLRANNGPKLNAGFEALWFFRGSGPVLLGNLNFCDFPGRSVPPAPPPSGSAHALIMPLFFRHESTVCLWHLLHCRLPLSWIQTPWTLIKPLLEEQSDLGAYSVTKVELLIIQRKLGSYEFRNKNSSVLCDLRTPDIHDNCGPVGY